MFLPRLPDAGQTTDTHTRGETHDRVSERRGRRAEVGSEKPNALRAIATLLQKSGQALLSFDDGLVPTFSVMFDACELRGESCSMGVRCDNPIPHDFTSTLRCVLPSVALHLWSSSHLWVHFSWICGVSRLTRFDFLVCGLGAVCLRSAQLSQLHQMASKVFDVTDALFKF